MDGCTDAVDSGGSLGEDASLGGDDSLGGDSTSRLTTQHALQWRRDGGMTSSGGGSTALALATKGDEVLNGCLGGVRTGMAHGNRTFLLPHT